MSKKGFTLIELLIVVAIIGILAAIAIPNFLMAQVRAKVARAMADLDTCANAGETYFVDHNYYPVTDPGGFLPHTLTTPIAYLSNINLYDPFDPILTATPGQWRYTYHNLPWYELNFGWRTLWRELYGPWRSCSFGPDRSYYHPTYNSYLPPNGQHTQVYDPTNGTVSLGNIWFSQRRKVVQDNFFDRL